MTSPGQSKPQGTLQGAGPGPGVSSLKSCPAAPDTLGQLRDQFPRLLPRVTARLDSIYHLFTRVRQDLQEHDKQVEAFFQVAEACSQPLDGQPVEHQGCQEAPSPQAPQPPEAGTPWESDFEDVVTRRSSDWRQPQGRKGPTEAWDVEGLPPWDTQLQSWQDALSMQLWQIFADIHAKADQPRMTEQALGLESRGQAQCDSVSEGSSVLSVAESSPSSLESPQEETAGAGPAQESAGGASPFLKLISWDPEDFEDTWKRPDALSWQSRRFAVPHKLQKVRLLRHGEPVLATAISSFTRHVYTCSRGGVKVWSLAGQVMEDRFPDSHLPSHKALGAYLRTCLLTPNSRTLFTGGCNLGSVSVWDLAAPSLHVKSELLCAGLTCQALAADLEENLAFAGFSKGLVRIWDLRDRHVVRDLPGQQNGAKTIAVKHHTVWTGGLDAHLRRWDLRMAREPLAFLFESQIMSLSHSPREDWVLLGLANGEHWLQHSSGSQTLMVGRKDSTVLGLKFSPYGQWWVSVGMDNLVSIHSMPTGAKVFQVPETSCILCCDVSSDNRLVVVGCGDQALVYQVTY